jgi:hypothetical protein
MMIILIIFSVIFSYLNFKLYVVCITEHKKLKQVENTEKENNPKVLCNEKQEEVILKAFKRNAFVLNE